MAPPQFLPSLQHLLGPKDYPLPPQGSKLNWHLKPLLEKEQHAIWCDPIALLTHDALIPFLLARIMPFLDDESRFQVLQNLHRFSYHRKPRVITVNIIVWSSTWTSFACVNIGYVVKSLNQSRTRRSDFLFEVWAFLTYYHWNKVLQHFLASSVSSFPLLVNSSPQAITKSCHQCCMALGRQ